MKKNKISGLIISMLLVTNIATPVLAHSGRTDASGGHRDTKNKSGLGSYHYHHGFEAHLHPGGVCPFSGGNATTSGGNTTKDTQKEKTTARQSGYKSGYNDGYAGERNLPVANESKYPEEYEEGYKDGYQKGADKLNSEKDSVAAKGKEAGYTDGFNGNENNSSNYKGSHLESYKNGYDFGYKEGIEKRNLEIDKIKSEAIELGKQDGYIQSKKEKLEYSGKYEEEYIKGYDEGYSLGVKKLNEDLKIEEQKAFLGAIQGLSLDESIYNNEFIKVKAIEAHKKGIEFKDKYLNVGSLIGSSLESIQAKLKEATKINIGLDNLKDDIFIAVDNSNEKKVRVMNIYPKSITEKGFTMEESKLILKNFFTEEVSNKYEHKKSFISKEDNSLKVFRLKRKNRDIKYLPSNLYISMKYEDNLVTSIKISYRKPSKLKSV